MKLTNCFKRILTLSITIILLTNCARDLSDNVYTSDSTLNLTLEGEVMAIRAIKIKETDRATDNTGGIIGGGALGGAVGSNIGGGGGNTTAIVGGAILGATAGALVQGKLGEQKGFEYLVKVDTSKIKSNYYEGSAAMRNVISTAVTTGLVTIIQTKSEYPISEGQKVYIIFSDKRTRIIPVRSN